MLEEKAYQSVNKTFPLIAAVIDWSTECEKKAYMKTVQSCSSEIVVDVARKTGQQAWSKDDLCNLEAGLRSFRRRW